MASFLSLGFALRPDKDKYDQVNIDNKDSTQCLATNHQQVIGTTAPTPFQTNMILFFPWSRMKHSSESRSLWRNGFSSFTTVTCIDPDASDTWWQTTQVQKIGPRFFPSLGSETTTSSFASQSNKILYDTHTWDEHYIAIPQITWRNSQQWHWNHKFSPNTVIG